MDFELLAFDNYTTKFVVAGNYDGIKKKYTETNHTIEWATDDGLPPPGLRLDQQDYTQSGNPDWISIDNQTKDIPKCGFRGEGCPVLRKFNRKWRSDRNYDSWIVWTLIIGIRASFVIWLEFQFNRAELTQKNTRFLYRPRLSYKGKETRDTQNTYSRLTLIITIMIIITHPEIGKPPNNNI